MTSDERLFTELTRVCPGTYVAWPIGKAPALPWFTYKRQNGGEVFAGNANYGLLPRYRVELLFKEKDPVLVRDFEEALTRLGTWKLYDADYMDGENCIEHDYRLTLLPNREEEDYG